MQFLNQTFSIFLNANRIVIVKIANFKLFYWVGFNTTSCICSIATAYIAHVFNPNRTLVEPWSKKVEVPHGSVHVYSSSNGSTLNSNPSVWLRCVKTYQKKKKKKSSLMMTSNESHHCDHLYRQKRGRAGGTCLLKKKKKWTLSPFKSFQRPWWIMERSGPNGDNGAAERESGWVLSSIKGSQACNGN